MLSTFEAYAQEIRELARQGDQSEVQKMLLLVELKELKSLWGNHYRDWRALLEKEKFCGVNLYERFYCGLHHVSEEEAVLFGVRTIAYLGSLPMSERDLATQKVRRWVRVSKAVPETRLINEFVRKAYPRPLPKTSETKVQRLEAYVRKLSALLRRHNIPVPPMPGTSSKRSISANV